MRFFNTTVIYPRKSTYGVSKLDSIVEEVVRQIFAQFREVSRKKLLESVKTNDAARIQKKIKKIQKDLEAKQKELDDLKAETILVIRGVSALDKELLGTLVAEAREALETLEKQLVQAQNEYEEATKTAKRSNYICNELFTTPPTTMNAAPFCSSSSRRFASEKTMRSRLR